MLWNLGWFADPVYLGDYVSAHTGFALQVLIHSLEADLSKVLTEQLPTRPQLLSIVVVS